MRSAKDVRQEFIDFFRSKGHEFVPSASVVPADDPTLLFTNAGMNQFKDIFLGARTPSYTRAVNSQKCIRVSGKHNDLEEVGKDTYHHTFFEMLGNWSFGDYFKAEAIQWAWELLTEVWTLDANRLWATVFGGDATDSLPPDTQAEGLWIQRTTIPEERVLRFGRKDNFWEMGDTGPCGPCSEIHLDLGPDHCDRKNDPKHICQVNGDCGRFIELWNLVFIQYNRDDSGALHELPATHVDTGAGLERVTSVLQDKTSNYDTDLFMPILKRIGEISGKPYSAQLGNETDNAFRVIADHIRCLTFAIADGATPGNEGRSYVLRRILRRATRFGLLLDLHKPFLHQLVPAVVEVMGEAFPGLADRATHVANVLQAEEESFRRTLERGIDIFEADVRELEEQNSRMLPGDKAFRLYDTYGFPLDLTQLMAEERGLTVDTTMFNELMEQQRAQARAGQKEAAYKADALSHLLPETDHTHKYHTDTLSARIVGYTTDSQFHAEGDVPADTQVGLVLDHTCAYPESGGQVGDTGVIEKPDAIFAFDNTRLVGSAVVHFGKTASSVLTVGDSVTIRVDPGRRDTQRNHTATHLLQWALQQTLGPHAHQEGSLVCPEHLRFDFTAPRPLTPEQIETIETLVRKKIRDSVAVLSQTMPIEQARKLGAMALFSEKYGDNVRVLAIGADSVDHLEEAFSREFCGGTHVENTADIGDFKIVREESVATGVRRITAMTGRALQQYLHQRSNLVDELVGLLKTTPDQLVDRVSNLLADNKKLKRDVKKGAAADLKSTVAQLLENAPTFGTARLIVGQLPAAPVDAVRTQIDWLRKKAPSSVTILATATEDGKAMLFAAVTDDLIKQKDIKAGELVRELAPLVGGGGGGRPQMAQAGGKQPENIPQALDTARELVSGKLALGTTEMPPTTRKP